MLSWCLSRAFCFDSMGENAESWLGGAPQLQVLGVYSTGHKLDAVWAQAAQVCGSPPCTDGPWMLAKAMSSPSRIGLAMFDLLWSR